VHYRKHAQSNAILHFVGGITGLYPSDPFEAAKVDEILAVTESVTDLLLPSIQEKDNTKKKAMREALSAGPLSELMKRIEASLSAQKAGPYLLGNKMSVADLKLGHQFHHFATGFLEFFPANYLEGYPLLNKLQATVYEHPKVKAFYGK